MNPSSVSQSAPLPATVPALYRRPGILALGTLVAGRYRVLTPVAQGGMGTVYRAGDTRFGVDVALKVATLSGGVYDLFRTRVQREARIGYLLGRHEGLVRALDWGEITPNETLFVAMDLVEGAHPLDPCRGSLRERLENLAVAAELVARVHSHGVVHRDIKPANFLVAEDGRISLGDFGEAKELDEVSGELAALHADPPSGRDGVPLGTPLYMPPEQFEEPRTVDARVDVYALGVMLYQALTGTYPYDARDTFTLLSRVLQARDGVGPLAPSPCQLNPSLPPDLDRLCRSALCLDRDRRLPSAEVFAHALRTHLAWRESA